MRSAAPPASSHTPAHRDLIGHPVFNRHHPDRPGPGARLVGLAFASFAATTSPLIALAESPPSPLQPSSPSSPSAQAAAHYDIPAGTLDQVLNRFAAEAGVMLAIDGQLTAGQSSPGLAGRYAVAAGLGAILAGTGLEAERRPDSSYAIRRALPPAAPDHRSTPATTLPEVVVTGATAWGELPRLYAGGQAARGGRLGLLGNRDFMETPFNQTILTEQAISDQQVRSVADLVSANDPSVTSGGGGTIGDGYTIRGMGYESAEVMVNGIPGIAPIWRINPNFIERVEVLKGPNALLHGATIWGSVGGAISVVPKRAGDEALTRVTAAFASDSRLSGHIDAGRRFGPDKAFGLRINGTIGSGDFATDHLSERQNQLAVALDWRHERIRISADLLRQKQTLNGGKWSYPTIGPGVTRTPSVPDNRRNWVQPWESSRVSESIAAARGEFDLTRDLTLYLAGGTSRSDEDYVTGTATLQDDAGTLTRAFRTHRTPYRGRTVDAGLSGQWQTGPISHDWTLGYTRMYSENGNGIGTVDVSALVSNLHQPIVQPAPTAIHWSANGAPKVGERINTSFALVDTLSFNDGASQLTVGARRQTIENSSFNGQTGAVTAAYREAAWAPMAGFVQRLGSGVMAYGNYVEGLSPGRAAPATAANAGAIFAPFKTRQLEVGAKFDLGRMAVTTSLFQIERANGILDPVTNLFSNDGRQRNRGLEVNVFGEPLRGFRLLGGIAFIEAKQQRTAGGVNEGRTAAGQPRFRVNLGGEVDIAAVPGLSANARVIYRSSQYLDGANAMALPAWTRFDIGSRYLLEVAGRPVALRLGIENLFDRDYWQQGLFVGAPRTWLLSATVDF